MKLSRRTSLALIGTAAAVTALTAVAFAASTSGMLGMAGGPMGGGMMNGGMTAGGHGHMMGGSSCGTMMASGVHPMTLEECQAMMSSGHMSHEQCQAMMASGSMDPAHCQTMMGSSGCPMG